MRQYYLLLIFALFTFHLSAQNLYLISENNELFRLSVNGCSPELVVPLNYPTIDNISDLCFHPNGNLYGVSVSGNLFEIDTLSGNTNTVHTFPFNPLNPGPYNSLTASAAGIIYTIGAAGDLYSYDIGGGIETFIGNINAEASGDLAFYNGNLYVGASDDQPGLVIRIDLNDPSDSDVIYDNPLLLLEFIYGLTTLYENCGDDETTYLLDNSFFGGSSNLFRYNWNTNTVSLLCNFNMGFVGLASTSEYLASIPPIDISGTSTANTTCGAANGSISIAANGGFGQLEYSIDGINFQTSNNFDSLSGGGYTILVRDELGCLSMEEIEIESSEPVFVSAIEISPSSCGAEDGSIEIKVANESALFSLNGGAFTAINLFENLVAGDYSILIQNESGCEIEIDTLLESDNQNCKIDIPNAFTPNGDGVNDVFNIVTDPEFEGIIALSIFSRWGEIVYNNDELEVMNGWNGTKDGQAMPSDVYAYLFKITRNNEVEVFSGDVTLIR